MSFAPGTAPTAARRIISWAVAIGVMATSALVATPAFAADVDLVVNVSSDRGSYNADETAVHTVRVDNRGTGSTSLPATLTLTVPNVNNGTAAWENNIVCVAQNGAVCPTSYSRSNTVVTASIPSMPVAGSLTFTASVPGFPANNFRGSAAISAAVVSDSGDADLEPATNTSVVNIIISNPEADYGIGMTGPETATAGSIATYDVVLKNNGVKNSVYADLLLNGLVGTGTPASPIFQGLTFVGVECLNEMGGALCANLRTVDGGSVSPVQTTPPTATGTLVEHGILDMPSGSSVTLRYTLNVGAPACNAAATGANRVVTVTASSEHIYGSGSVESGDLVGDNQQVIVTNVPALPCTSGDISTVSVTQPQSQLTNGVALGGAFEYTAQFSNLSGDTATDAPITFIAGWPGGPGTTISSSPACVPSGGATCPTSWAAGTNSMRGVGAVFPVGGSLAITFTGTGGTDDTSVCRPRTMTAAFQVQPPFGFIDTNWVPNQSYLQGQGNNARQASTPTAVGSPCVDSHDDSVQSAGPFTDPAATIPLAGPLTPGQVVYFKSNFTNQLDSPDYTTWRISQSGQMPIAGAIFDTTNVDRGFRHQPGDQAGISYRDDDVFGGELVIPFDTGVRCIAVGGATCPTQLASTSATGGGGQLWMNGWTSYWKTGTMPVMPAGSSYSVISSYKVPPLASRYALGGCVPEGVNFGTGTGAGTRTTADIPFRTEIVALTNPATFDRNNNNDSTTVNVPLVIPRCTNTLAVSKTALTPKMPLDREVKYQIVATNTSSQPLDIPRIIDTLSLDAPATIECVSTTLNAVCPTFTPLENVRYFGNGTTGPITYRASAFTPIANFDFAWGTIGTPTMPPGSAVTFEVTAQYPAVFSGNVSNLVNFLGDANASGGSWSPVVASASVTSPAGSKLSIAKKVAPVNPRPGGVVTFSVDIVNTGASLPQARFTDAVNPLLAPSNTSGYSNLTCRPLTEADNVLLRGVAVGSVACPTFTSDATGINGLITGFQNNSGLRITYTAVAPLTAASLPNIAVLTQDDTQVSTGDASSQANFLVMTARVAGTVWDDANGSAEGTFANIDTEGETPTNAGGLNAVLIDAETGEVITVVPVNADGTYEFVSAPVLTNVSVAITTGNPGVGTTFTTPTLPSGWIATSPLAQEVFNTGVIETIDKDFGIEQPPATDDKIDPIVPNPGGSVQVQVPSLTGSDPEDGSLGTGKSFQIVTLPTSGTLYYDGVAVTAGQIIANYDPTKLTVDPAPGAVTVVFTVVAIDAAGVPDPTPATVTMPFSVSDAASISGSVWFDANKNGVKDAGEVGIAGVTVTLRGVDDAGNTVELQTVTDNAGDWTFSNLPPGGYSVREEQPGGYDDGIDQLGSGAAGQGSAGNDGFTEIVLIGGQAAINYNFGEILEEVVAPPKLGTPALASTGSGDLGGGLIIASVLAALGLLLLIARRRRIEGSHK